MDNDLANLMLAALLKAREVLQKSPHVSGVSEQCLWDLDEAIRLGTEAMAKAGVTP